MEVTLSTINMLVGMLRPKGDVATIKVLPHVVIYGGTNDQF